MLNNTLTCTVRAGWELNKWKRSEPHPQNSFWRLAFHVRTVIPNSQERLYLAGNSAAKMITSKCRKGNFSNGLTKHETDWWHGSSSIILWGGFPAAGPGRLENPKGQSDSQVQSLKENHNLGKIIFPRNNPQKCSKSSTEEDKRQHSEWKSKDIQKFVAGPKRAVCAWSQRNLTEFKLFCKRDEEKHVQMFQPDSDWCSRWFIYVSNKFIISFICFHFDVTFFANSCQKCQIILVVYIV